MQMQCVCAMKSHGAGRAGLLSQCTAFSDRAFFQVNPGVIKVAAGKKVLLGSTAEKCGHFCLIKKRGESMKQGRVAYLLSVYDFLHIVGTF